MSKKRKITATEETPQFETSIQALEEDRKIFVDKSLAIAHYIHLAMQQQGLKQKDLAERMNKTEAELSKILSGMQNLTLRTIAKLEAALGCPIIQIPHSIPDPAISFIKNTSVQFTSKLPTQAISPLHYSTSGGIIKMHIQKTIHETGS